MKDRLHYRKHYFLRKEARSNKATGSPGPPARPATSLSPRTLLKFPHCSSIAPNGIILLHVDCPFVSLITLPLRMNRMMLTIKRLALLLLLVHILCALSDYVEWPGSQKVNTADEKGALQENLSGLYFQSGTGSGVDDVIWSVKNKPSTLIQLKYNSSSALWVQSASWGMHYSSGGGDPDAEDLTMAEPGSPNVYVCTEQDNEVKQSRLSVLMFRAQEGVEQLSALQEWDLTEDLPTVDHNGGLEAITWVPDSFLLQRGLIDQSRGGEIYDPANYPGHGGGLFFVGLEETGGIFVYALTHLDASTRVAANAAAAPSPSPSPYTRITSFPSGLDHIMALHFDDLSSASDSDSAGGLLWATCDDSCKGHAHVFSLPGGGVEVTGSTGQRGVFQEVARLTRPGDMPNLNNEGFITFPEALCDPASNRKGALWSDDAASDGHALRQGTVPCGEFTAASRGVN